MSSATEKTKSGPEYDYFAFISYSHRDARWAKWLHRSLESYRLPVGVIREDGSVPPSRIRPVFRDRDELPAAGNLSTTIQEALRQTRFLIILCSQNSAASRYVNAEIETFSRLHGKGRVFAVIIDGEPPECFPKALLAGGKEPIAADARTEGDGKGDARLKLLAGLLGVKFDSLKRREIRRQRARWLSFSVITAMIAMAMAALAWESFQARKIAEAAESKARETLAHSRFLQACDLIAKRDTSAALALLANAVKEDPESQLTATRLQTLIEYRNFAVPIASFRTDERSMAFAPYFHPEKDHFYDGERIWDLSTRDYIQSGVDPGWIRSPMIGLSNPLFPSLLPAGLLSTRLLQFHGSSDHPSVTIEHEDSINSHAFSPQGNLVATSSDDRTARIWDIPAGKPVGAIMQHEGRVNSVAFSESGDRLLTTSGDDTARIWSAEGESLADPLLHSNAVLGGIFSPDGMRIATWTLDHEIYLWTIGEAKPDAVIPAHQRQITKLCFDRDGVLLASASHDRTVKIWDADDLYAHAERQLLYEPVFHPDSVLQVAFSGNGSLLATAAGDRRTRVFELRRVSPPGESSEFSHELVSPLRKFMVNRFPFRISRHSTKTDLPISFPSPLEMRNSGSFGHIVFSPEEDRLATLHEDGKVRVWDIGNNGELLATFPDEEGGDLEAAVFSPDTEHLAVLNDEITIFHLESEKPVISHELVPDRLGFSIEYPKSAAFSPDGSIFAATFISGSLQPWSFPEGEPLAAPLDARSSSLIRFSRDGRKLISGSFNGIHIWNTEEFFPETAAPTFENSEAIAISIEKEIAAVLLDYPREAYVWDIPTGQFLAGPISSGRWEPDSISLNKDATAITVSSHEGEEYTFPLRDRESISDHLVVANAIAGQKLDPDTGVATHSVDWNALRALSDPITQQPIFGEWSFEQWVDAQFPPASAKEAFALAKRFPSDSIVNAGLAAYFIAAEWPEPLAKKMKALAPDFAAIAEASTSIHPLTSYWLAYYYASRNDIETASRHIRLARRELPDDERVEELAGQIDEAIALKRKKSTGG